MPQASFLTSIRSFASWAPCSGSKTASGRARKTTWIPERSDKSSPVLDRLPLAGGGLVNRRGAEMVRTLRFLSWEGRFPGTCFQVVVPSSVKGRVAELTTATHRSVTLSGVMRSGVGWTRQSAGEDPQNGCPDLCRLPCLTHPKIRGTKGRRRAPNGTSAAAAVITHETRKGNFGPLKKV